MGPRVGELVKQRYRVLRLIGDGGMGSVFEARHELLGTSVALKFLHPHLMRREGLKQRFLQEAQMSARIKSEHVVRASDVDESESGLAFFVMEYVSGGTLLSHYETLQAAGRWLTRAEAFDYILQIIEGVEAAHALGIIHRDLKPDNVMMALDPSGHVLLKILDFGIAKLKATDTIDRGLTAPGSVMGTPEYMAPEQALSPMNVDRHADVFALGVMFYEMLAAKRPVEGGTPVAIADAYLRGRIRRLDQLVRIEPALAEAVHRAIAPRPEQRFDTVAQFREAIEERAASALATPAGAPASEPRAEPTLRLEPPRAAAPKTDASAFARTAPSEPRPLRPHERLGAATVMSEPPSHPGERGSEPPQARTVWSEPPPPIAIPQSQPPAGVATTHPSGPPLGATTHPSQPPPPPPTAPGAPFGAMAATVAATPMAGVPLPPGAAITVDDARFSQPMPRASRAPRVVALAVGLLVVIAAIVAGFAYGPRLLGGKRGASPATSAPTR